MSAIVKAKAPPDDDFSPPESADENDVYTILMAFLKAVIPLKKVELALVKGQENRVAFPKPPAVVMQLTQQTVLSLNESRYTDTHKIIHNHKETEIQIDFYGTRTILAQKMATHFIDAFNDAWTTDFFKEHSNVIHPLYVDSVRNSAFISGENEYNDRYTVIAYFDVQSEMGLCQQSAKEIEIKVRNVSS